MENKKYVIGIDIGSSNVVMAVGERNENGELTILGVDVQEVGDSVKDGDITNPLELGKAIKRAKSALEGELGLQLNSAYVGVSGRSVYCVRYEDYVDVNTKSNCVTEAELRELNARINMVVPAGGDKIIQRIPLRYGIDNRQDVQNPLGAFGHRLKATYLFVLISRQLENFVNQAMYNAQIKLDGLCVNPMLLPDVLLNPCEKEEGVVIVDIGSDLTDISVVRENKLWYFVSLPIGASSINNDLHEFLKISKKEINALKHKYGSAIADSVPDNTSISVKTAGHAKKQILQRNIAEIAEERLKDIAQYVLRELKTAKFSTKVPCGVVLTGGSAYLADIDRLFARELNMEVRLGDNLNGLDDDSRQSISAYPQSAVMGLLLYGANHNVCEATTVDTTNVPPIAPPIAPPTTPVNGPVNAPEEPKKEEPKKEETKKEETIVEPPKEEKPTEVPPTTKGENKSEYTNGQPGSNGPKDETKDKGNNLDKDNNRGNDKDGSKGKKGWLGTRLDALRDWIDNRFEQKNDFI